MLKPVIYGELQHYLFLLPVIAFIGSIGFVEMSNLLKNRRVILLSFILLILLNIVFVTKTLYVLHPYEYVYFNELIGRIKGAKGKFELDYHGASYREAVLWLRDYLDRKKDNKVYFVKTCGHPASSTYYFSNKMRWTDNLKKADYFICYTRGEEYKLIGEKNTIFTVKRAGVVLNYGVIPCFSH